MLVLALAAGTGTPFASQPQPQSFRVTVTLNTIAQQASVAQCGTTVEPNTNKVNLACMSAPAPRDIPRYLLHVYRAGEWITVDGQMGTGTLTSWRIVHVANREYLEMMVGW